MRARHRLTKLLLRQGIVYYGGHGWTAAHDRWLRQQRLDNDSIAARIDGFGRPATGLCPRHA